MHNVSNMSLKDFDEKLKYHDWYYNFSDDGRVWRAGEEEQTKIIGIAKQSPDHQKLFQSWSQYHFSGENWNKPKFTEEQLNDVRSSLGVI